MYRVDSYYENRLQVTRKYYSLTDALISANIDIDAGAADVVKVFNVDYEELVAMTQNTTK